MLCHRARRSQHQRSQTTTRPSTGISSNWCMDETPDPKKNVQRINLLASTHQTPDYRCMSEVFFAMLKCPVSRCQCLFRVLQFAVDCGGRFLCSRLGPMLDYSRLILEYASRHGTLTWPLLYQCDVRCQLEHVERLRRVLERNHALSKRQAPAIPFDLNWPLDSVWDDQSFWHRQFGEPAQGGTLDRCRYRRSTNPK